jgi:hypothetical protein
LTLDGTVRLHSCEKGNYCDTVQNSRVVWIRPIITRINGQHVAEIGVGGGGEDLEREAELDYLSPSDVAALLEASVYMPRLFPAQAADRLGYLISAASPMI